MEHWFVDLTAKGKGNLNKVGEKKIKHCNLIILMLTSFYLYSSSFFPFFAAEH